MDPLTSLIRRISPTDPAVAGLIDRHLTLMASLSPPESRHVQTAEGLEASGAEFFVMEADGRPVAMGAIKVIAPGHAEIKSMHVLAEMRGQGLAQAILAHLLDEARRRACVLVSLETGAQAGFSAARALYLAHGFTYCGPFGTYRDDPNSVFLTRTF